MFELTQYFVAGRSVQPAYKVVQIQEMSAYSVRFPGPYSCVYIGIGESRLFGFSGYRGGHEPFHISGLHCTCICVRNKVPVHIYEGNTGK